MIPFLKLPLITLESFKSQIEAREPFQINRQTDSCNWFFKDERLFHERSYWPWNLLNPMTTEYWGETIYTYSWLARQHAKIYNGEVQKSWYCEENNPTWFIIFKDFDDVVKYVFETQKNTYD